MRGVKYQMILFVRIIYNLIDVHRGSYPNLASKHMHKIGQDN